MSLVHLLQQNVVGSQSSIFGVRHLEVAVVRVSAGLFKNRLENTFMSIYLGVLGTHFVYLFEITGNRLWLPCTLLAHLPGATNCANSFLRSVLRFTVAPIFRKFEGTRLGLANIVLDEEVVLLIDDSFHFS